MIVNGYAFTKIEIGVRVVNLNEDGHCVVISRDGEVLESSMDPIEEHIVLDIWRKDSQYMGDRIA